MLRLQTRQASIWSKAKEMMSVYYNGSKLLVQELKQRQQYEFMLAKGQTLTRPQYLLIHRNKQDAKRVVPFFFLMVFLPEAIPFLLFRGSGMIPSTCITPSQQLKRLEKMALQRKSFGESLKTCLSLDLSLEKLMQNPHLIPVDHFGLEQASRSTLIECSKCFGFSIRVPNFVMKINLKSHFQFIAQDDLRIELDQLGLDELKTCLEERGM